MYVDYSCLQFMVKGRHQLLNPEMAAKGVWHQCLLKLVIIIFTLKSMRNSLEAEDLGYYQT